MKWHNAMYAFWKEGRKESGVSFRINYSRRRNKECWIAGRLNISLFDCLYELSAAILYSSCSQSVSKARLYSRKDGMTKVLCAVYTHDCIRGTGWPDKCNKVRYFVSEAVLGSAWCDWTECTSQPQRITFICILILWTCISLCPLLSFPGFLRHWVPNFP